MAQPDVQMSPITIDKNTDGVTYASADITDASTYSTLLTYKVPLGVAIEITPSNYIFGQYYGTGGTTSGDIISAGSTKIEKKNATGASSIEIFKGSNGIFGDIGDELKRPRLKTKVLVNSSEQIIVSVVNTGTTLDVSSSNFSLEGVQIYNRV